MNGKHENLNSINKFNHFLLYFPIIILTQLPLPQAMAIRPRQLKVEVIRQHFHYLRVHHILMLFVIIFNLIGGHPVFSIMLAAIPFAFI